MPGQFIPICNFLCRCLQDNPVVTGYLLKVRDEWGWLEKHLAECDPALYHMTTYNLDNPNEDIRSIYMKLKSFWDATRPKEQISAAGGEEGGVAGAVVADVGVGVGVGVSVPSEGDAPVAVFRSEWNEDLDAVPRSFDQVFLS